MPKQFLKLDNVTLITCYQSSYLLGMVFTNILLLEFSCSERSVLKIYIFIFLLKIRLWQNSWSMVAQICKLTVQVSWNIWITTSWVASSKNRIQARNLNQKMFSLWWKETSDDIQTPHTINIQSSDQAVKTNK